MLDMLMSCRYNFVLTLCVEITSYTHEVHLKLMGRIVLITVLLFISKVSRQSEPLLVNT